MGSNDIPDELDDDFVNEGNFTNEDECNRFTCPFCGSVDYECPHFLGSRDLQFSDDFAVDDSAPLSELGELFRELGEAVTPFVAVAKKRHIAALRPKRLQDLVRAVADGKHNDGFTEYIERIGKDTKLPFEAGSYEENGAPGFCSIVRMFWAKNPSETIDGMRTRMIQDIRCLNGPANVR